MYDVGQDPTPSDSSRGNDTEELCTLLALVAERGVQIQHFEGSRDHNINLWSEKYSKSTNANA